ncbi:MAG: DUF1385 domain-containing protein [Eubacterium sp.]
MQRAKRMRPSGIGGQAVIEGIMMRNKDGMYATAVRKPDKKIEIDIQQSKSITKNNKILRLPFIRGVFCFVDSMVIGVKTLTYSAGFYEEDVQEQESKTDKLLGRLFGEKAEDVVMGLTVALSMVLAIAIFMLLPLFISELISKYVGFVKTAWIPAIEGVVKIIIFVVYVMLISLMKDIQRTFMYHGAEHKCINCIEHGLELNVENVRKSSRQHKRCGTSFLLIVMIISIIFFMFIRSDNILIRYGLRLLLIPVIAGVSYEFIKLAGSTNNKVIGILSMPGLWLQKLTTREPSDDMIEVGIAAVEAVFDWRHYLRLHGIEVEEKESQENGEEY